MKKKQLRNGSTRYQLWHPINIYEGIKSLYFALFPKGSQGYEITFGFIKIFLKQFNLLNLYYREWLREFDIWNNEDLKQIRAEIEKMEAKPAFSIILPVYNPHPPFLEQAIQSVCDQVYPYWELCIADDASTNPHVHNIIKTFSDQDPRIKFTIREKNGHISAASNSALDLATHEYIALLDHDDLLHPLALYFVSKEINHHPDSVIIFTDEDKITKRGRRLDPYFKPEFDYELLLSQNMVSHLGVYRRDAVVDVGCFRIGLEGSQDYDLLLRVLENCRDDQICHIPLPLYHWRISNKSVSRNVNIKPYAVDAGVQALNEHLSRKQTRAKGKFLPGLAGYLVSYDLPNPLPEVTLVIFAQTLSDKLKKCITDVLLNTDYQHYFIHLWLPAATEIRAENLHQVFPDQGKIKFYSYAGHETYSKIVNDSMTKINTEFICLLDESLYGYPQHWLIDLVGQAAQPMIGAVAPKLIAEKKRVYSNGVLILPDRIASHHQRDKEQSDNGYFGWAKLCRGFSALSEKCLVFKKTHWTAVKGMDEKIHSPLLSGVDFCLKLKTQGYRNILRPSVELYYQGQMTDGKQGGRFTQFSEEDKAILKERWQAFILDDPAFNPNLAIIDEGKIIVNLAPKTDFPKASTGEEIL